MLAASYDLRALIYDRLWRRYTDRTLNFLLDHADLISDARVIDVGCGTGALEVRLVEKYPHQHITGVDPSPRMLDRARAKLGNHPNVRLVEASAEQLPFPDGAFDAAVSASAFHHFHHPQAALSEIRRVLTTGAALYLLDWCRDYPSIRIRDFLLRRVDPAHVRCYSSTELSSLLSGAGFRVEDIVTGRAAGYGIMLARAQAA